MEEYNKDLMDQDLNFKFGVEIEFFGVTRPKVLDKLLENNIDAEIQLYNHNDYTKWKIVWDGSVTSDGTELITDLHGEKVYKGIEIVSPILYGIDGFKQLQTVYKCLNEIGAKIDKTCGTHVHLDASNLTVDNTKNILIFYYNNQKLFDSILPKSRRSNNCEFCKPISRNEIISIKKAKTKQGIGFRLKTRHKVVNARSYRREGHCTIEFRQFNGSLNYDKIKYWILLVHNIVKYCCELDTILTIKHNDPLIKQINSTIKNLKIKNTNISKFILKRIKKFN